MAISRGVRETSGGVAGCASRHASKLCHSGTPPSMAIVLRTLEASSRTFFAAPVNSGPTKNIGAAESLTI